MLDARQWFILQIKELKAAKVSWSISLHLPDVREEEVLCTTYGLKLNEVDWNQAVSTGELGLLRHPSIHPGVLSFDPTIVLGGSLSRRCQEAGVVQREGLREWARMNPGLVNMFIDRMKNDSVFLLRYEKSYDPLRLIAWRTLDAEPRSIRRLEIDLTEKGRAMVEHEFQQMRKATELAEVLTQRWQVLREAQDKGGSLLRAKWRQSLPGFPEWKRKTRRGKKRGRSRS